jgi:putative transposase
MRLKTTKNQGNALNVLLAQLCELYNIALQQRRDVWKSHHKDINFYDHCKQLTELRGGVEEYGLHCVAIQRDPLQRLDLAFKAFFRRVKAGQTPGYPRFKSLDRYDTFTVPKRAFTYKKGFVSISGLGTFRTKTGFLIKGQPVLLRVKRLGNKWAAHLVCDIGEAPAKKPVSKAIGIDLGLTALATLSDGSVIANPRWTRQEEVRLAYASSNLSSKKRGSKNRAKARERVRRVHQRITGKRSSYLHGVSASLIQNYDLIAYEGLKISNMVTFNMAKSIMDAAWAQLIRQLVYKAEWAGKHTVAVNPRNTTKACSGCGVLVPKTLDQRRHDCLDCGLSLGRDHNAAINILSLGKSAALQAEYAL